MYSLSIQNKNGDVLQLSQNKNYEVWATGLNDLAASINSTKAANSDGARKNSARLNERNIVLYIKIMPPVAVNRNILYKYFNPKSDIRLFYKNELRDVYIDGTIDTLNIELFTNNEIAQISILCHDPYYKAATESIYDFVNVNSLFTFPFSIPAEGIPFSEILRESTKTVTHGDVESGMIIEFYATTSQILQPAFYNRTAQQYIKILADMEQGDRIRINTNDGEKSIVLIRDGIETNIINQMEKGSKWVKFTAGENVISYSADEGAENLNCTVTTVNKYMGV